MFNERLNRTSKRMLFFGRKVLQSTNVAVIVRSYGHCLRFSF